MTTSDDNTLVENPFSILGVAYQVSDEELRQRYVKLVRQHPPERDRKAFQRIRTAYEALQSPSRRAYYALRYIPEPDAVFPGAPGEPQGPLGISPAWWLMGDPWSDLTRTDFASDCRDPFIGKDA